nr:hypothetical protein [Eubacterium sp.]
MTVTEKVKSAEKRIKNTVNIHPFKCAAFFLLGLLFSLGSVFGELHPFGIPITAVSGKRYFLFTAAGAVTGSLLTGLDGYSARYLCAVTLASLGALAAAAFELNLTPAFPMGISFISCLATGLVLHARLQSETGAYLITAGEAILSTGGAFFFYRALHAGYRRLRLKALPVSDITCLVISVSLLLMNTASLRIFIFSPAVAAASFAVLCTV